MKKIMLAILVTAVLLGGSGCMNRKEVKIQKMVDYMNEKYSDDTFVYGRLFGGELGAKNVKIIVYSEKFPGADIRVLSNEENGKLYIRDNYLGIKFEEDTREFLRDRISGVYGDNIYVSYRPDDMACTENGSSEMTFKEYISSKSSYVTFNAAVISRDADEETAWAEITDMFQGIPLSGTIYYISEDVQLSGEAGKENANEIFREKNYRARVFFIKDAEDHFSSFDWEEKS